MAQLLENIYVARIKGLIVYYFERYAVLDLLIIDDFGMKKLDGQLLDLMEVVEDRREKHSTIIVSQLPVGNWYNVL